MSGYRHMCGSTTSLTLKYKTRILNDNDDDDSSDDENEGDDIDENAFPDAGVFEGTLTNIEGVGDKAIIDGGSCVQQKRMTMSIAVGWILLQMMSLLR